MNEDLKVKEIHIKLKDNKSNTATITFTDGNNHLMQYFIDNIEAQVSFADLFVDAYYKYPYNKNILEQLKIPSIFFELKGNIQKTKIKIKEK